MMFWSRQLSALRRIAFDSSALIYYVECRSPYGTYVAEALTRLQRGEAFGIVSAIVEMELFVKPLREQDAEVLEGAELLFRTMPNLIVRPVDRAVARKAADVCARTRLDPMDAVIAATALEEHCDGIIGNDAFFARHFTEVPYLYLDDYVLL